MRRVLIDEVRPGMVLAKPIMNSSGMVVVGAGLMLDDAIIERLEQMGKQAIYVEGTALPDVARSLAEQEQELDHRFRKVKHDARQMKIRTAISAYLRHVAPEPSSSCAMSDPVHAKQDAGPGGEGVGSNEQGPT